LHDRVDGEQKLATVDMSMRIVIVDRARKEVLIYDMSEPPSTPPPHIQEPVKRLTFAHSNDFVFVHVTRANELAFAYKPGKTTRFLAL
jgi:hypothetical protein